MHKLGFFGLLTMIASGCSGDDGEDARSRAQFCDEWAAAACSDETVSACQAASVEDCRVAQEAYCLGLVPDGFADDRADACLTAVARAYGDARLSAAELLTVLRLGPPCDRLIRGPQGEGESCTESSDCDGPGGYTCVLKGGAAMGVCEIPETVAAGRSCAAAQQVCAEGFFCNGQNCIEFLAPGAACSNQDECGTQSYCSAAGTCAARSPVNTPCTSDLECLSGVCFNFGTEQVCTDTLVLSRSEPHCETLR